MPVWRDWVSWVTTLVWVGFMALAEWRSLELIARRRFLYEFGLLDVGHVSPHPALHVLKTMGFLTLAAAAIGGALAGCRLFLRYRAIGQRPMIQASDRPVLLLGIAAVVISGAGTYLYFASLLLYPLLMILFAFACRRYDRSSSRRGASLFGVALGVAALVIPLSSLASWIVVIVVTDRGGPAMSGEPFFYAIFTPPVVVLMASIIIAWRVNQLRSLN